jgi:hypothetical protein
MKLFELDEAKMVKINKPWILLIPEFAALYRRDKGSAGDYDGRKKLRTFKEFTFIYFYVDFRSPISSWEPEEKRKEALYYANLTEKEIDSEIDLACKKYEQLQIEASRSLRTLRSVRKGIDAFDAYMENIDFNETDDDGKLKHSPDKFVMNIARINKMYDELAKLEKRVEEDLKDGGTGIRGTAIKGENEDKDTQWSEEDIAKGSLSSRGTGLSHEAGAGGPSSNGASMIGLGKTIHNKNLKSKFTDGELEDI